MSISPVAAIGDNDTARHVANMGRVLALRARILEQSETLGQLARGVRPAAVAGGETVAPVAPGSAPTPAAGFGDALQSAMNAVNKLQSEGSAASNAWERGDTQDIASVMLARQKASIAFEATLQVRNRLLSAYRDIMNMPV
jgi:flagellar hook-basal body complex protein FliE